MQYFTIVSGSIPKSAFEKICYISKEKAVKPKPINPKRILPNLKVTVCKED